MTFNERTGDALDNLRAAAAERLGDVWGGTVALERADVGRGTVSGRSHVLRFSLVRAPAGRLWSAWRSSQRPASWTRS
jgi:hypothetical protein